MRTVRGTGHWLAGAGTLLAILTCYGTLALVALLSVLGVSIAIHEGAWAAAISAFAGLAVFGVALGYRRHGALRPPALAGRKRVVEGKSVSVSVDLGGSRSLNKKKQ